MYLPTKQGLEVNIYLEGCEDMRKEGLQNAEIQRLITSLGHTQSIVVSDVGLPIPDGVPVIDLALADGIPDFFSVLRPVARELVYEKYIYASEMSKELLAEMKSVLGGAAAEAVPHEEFKRLTREARAIIRTGARTPYANVILIGGVNF
jgi:D-ribose pyranase